MNNNILRVQRVQRVQLVFKQVTLLPEEFNLFITLEHGSQDSLLQNQH
jgi:hypothetical protein